MRSTISTGAVRTVSAGLMEEILRGGNVVFSNPAVFFRSLLSRPYLLTFLRRLEAP